MVLGLWQDRPAEDAIDTPRLADRLGYGRLWIGETANFDAVALAMAVASVRQILQRPVDLAIDPDPPWRSPRSLLGRLVQ